MFGWKKLAAFAGGVLFGTAGISILKSQDAKKAYTHCTAAILRGRDAVMKTGTSLRENCSDIYQDASDINEQRYADADEKKLEEAKAMVESYQDKVKEYEAKVAENRKTER